VSRSGLREKPLQVIGKTMPLIPRHAAVSAALSLVVLLAIEKPFTCISGNFEQIKIELALCTTTPILEISCVYRSGVLAVVDQV